MLLPVLLDEARPPISFRGVQAADLRRDFEGQLLGLVDDIARIARAAPGDRTMIVPAGSYPPGVYAQAPPLPLPPQPVPQSVPEVSAASAPSPPWPHAAPKASPGVSSASRGPWWLAVAAASALLVAALFWWDVRLPADGRPHPKAGNQVDPAPVVAPRMVSVPDLKNRVTSVAAEIASSLKLRLVATDEQGQSHEPLPDGLVLEQSPDAGTQVAEGTVVTLKVAIQTATVPSVGGLSLGDALARLRSAGLDLGKVESIVGSGARAGTVVRQSPQAGTTVPQSTKVGVGVAAEARPARPVSKLAPAEEAARAAAAAGTAVKK